VCFRNHLWSVSGCSFTRTRLRRLPASPQGQHEQTQPATSSMVDRENYSGLFLLMPAKWSSCFPDSLLIVPRLSASRQACTLCTGLRNDAGSSRFHDCGGAARWQNFFLSGGLEYYCRTSFKNYVGLKLCQALQSCSKFVRIARS